MAGPLSGIEMAAGFVNVFWPHGVGVGVGVGVGDGVGVGVGVGVGGGVGVIPGLRVGVGVGVPDIAGQVANLKLPIRVLQLKVPFVAMYCWVYQKVQSSTGSTLKWL